MDVFDCSQVPWYTTANAKMHHYTTRSRHRRHLVIEVEQGMQLHQVQSASPGRAAAPAAAGD